MSQSKNPFCEDCQKGFLLLDGNTLCRHCFGFCDEGQFLCPKCLQGKKVLPCKVAAVFDNVGPSATLLSSVKRGEFVKEGAAFMVLQLGRLSWPLPDYIIPLPSYRSTIDYNLMLAKELSFFLKRPVIKILKIQHSYIGEYSLKNSFPFFKRKIDFANVELLFVCDTLEKRELLKKSADTLLELIPKKLSGLALCK